MQLIRKIRARLQWIIWSPINRLYFILNGASVGKNFKSNGKILLRNDGAVVKIGNNVRINSGTYYNPIGGGLKTSIQVLKNAELIIGDNVGLSNTYITCSYQVVIETFCDLGDGTKIFDTDFHSLDPMVRSSKNDYENATKKPVHIGNHVFIGTNSYILKGVEIGDNSVIGAASVITKNVPQNQIWAGNPARYCGTVLSQLQKEDKQ